jgi:hypothetical protein
VSTDIRRLSRPPPPPAPSTCDFKYNRQRPPLYYGGQKQKYYLTKKGTELSWQPIQTGHSLHIRESGGGGRSRYYSHVYVHKLIVACNTGGEPSHIWRRVGRKGKAYLFIIKKGPYLYRLWRYEHVFYAHARTCTVHSIYEHSMYSMASISVPCSDISFRVDSVWDSIKWYTTHTGSTLKLWKWCFHTFREANTCVAPEQREGILEWPLPLV